MEFSIREKITLTNKPQMSMPLSQSVTWSIWEGNVYTSFHEKAFLKGLFQLTAAIKKAYTNSSSSSNRSDCADLLSMLCCGARKSKKNISNMRYIRRLPK